MKKLLLFLLLVPMVTFGQNNVNVKNSTKIEGPKTNGQIMVENEGMSYLGEGLYRMQQTGSTDMAGYKRQVKKALASIKSHSDGLGLNYKIISQEKRKIPGGIGIPRAIINFMLLNKDGSPYESEEDKKLKIKDAQLEKEYAIEQLKELKGLLDLGLLTQEEFDKKAAELKKVILGN